MSIKSNVLIKIETEDGFVLTYGDDSMIDLDKPNDTVKSKRAKSKANLAKSNSKFYHINQ